jgi:hypothetical protein
MVVIIFHLKKGLERLSLAVKTRINIRDVFNMPPFRLPAEARGAPFALRI